MKPWLRGAEVAEYSGLSRDTIYAACERGELRHALDVQGGRIGGGKSQPEVAS